ncbi:MAG: hypothetical protein SH850_14045 [Planctomycetaceae bacterium]|nr:hypothetical protein [Planctomycetaceae bacterium]
MSAAHDLRTELRRLAARTGPNVTLDRFCREIGVARGTVIRLWGTWTQLRVAAGLPVRCGSARTERDIKRLWSLRDREMFDELHPSTIVLISPQPAPARDVR